MASGRPRVHVVPYWPANPYQPLLVGGLRRIGFEVETGTPLDSIGRGRARDSDRGDLVHLHWLPVAGAEPRRLARWWLFAHRVGRLRQRGVPVVWTAHNVVPHESSLPALDLWMSRTIAHQASRIICHSTGARTELIARLRIEDPDKVRVIPHGHYIESYPNLLAPVICRTKLDLPPDATVFLSLGAIRPYKGVLELIDAFRRLDAPAVRLLIAGKPHNDAIDAEVRKRAAGDARIRYTPGRVDDADLQTCFNAADAVVFPYRKTLTSGALILAMSFGRACIAPRLPGMADCIDEQGGILYDADKDDGLFDALSTAIGQRSTLAGMGATNLARARAWNWNAIAADTARCYDEAVGQAATAPGTSVRSPQVGRI